MAEEEDGKTEAASARRLQQAFDEGQVPLGRDVAAAVALTAGVVTLAGLAPWLMRELVALCAFTASGVKGTQFGTLPARAAPFALISGAVVGAAALGALVATVAQTKGGFWPHLSMPDLSRLFSPQRLTRLVSKEFLADLALAIVKVVAIGGAAYSALRDDFVTLPRLLFAATSDQLSRTYGPLANASVKVLTAVVFVAGLELAQAHLRFRKKTMMTKEEAKREYREDEGDPLIRSRRRRKHRELSKAHAAVEVPKADALVVNPTHIAIAIRYRKDEGGAPRVLAKGKGQLAENMREIARSNGIPIVQDIPLARLLYRKVKVGKQVPAETFKAVAAILAFVYRMTGKSGGAGARQ